MNIHLNIVEPVTFESLKNGDFFVCGGVLYRKYAKDKVYMFEHNVVVDFYGDVVTPVSVDIYANGSNRGCNYDPYDFDEP